MLSSDNGRGLADSGDGEGDAWSHCGAIAKSFQQVNFEGRDGGNNDMKMMIINILAGYQ